MADEELLNNDEEIQDSSAEITAGEENDSNDSPVAAEVADPELESSDESSESSDEASEATDVDSKKQAEQQMLDDLEKFDGDESQGVSLPDFPELADTGLNTDGNLDLLLDVNLPISIELGRTTMKIKDILNLGPGAVVELKKLAGEPVDLLVNNKVVARGEVVVVDENFGLRITSLLSPEERLRSLNE